MEAAPTVAGELFRFSINKKVRMKQLIDKLRHKHSLTGEEYAILLTCQDADTLMYLQQQAQEVTFRECHLYPWAYRGGQPMS